jgi:hypothetical protein
LKNFNKEVIQEGFFGMAPHARATLNGIHADLKA